MELKTVNNKNFRLNLISHKTKQLKFIVCRKFIKSQLKTGKLLVISKPFVPGGNISTIWGI